MCTIESSAKYHSCAYIWEKLVYILDADIVHNLLLKIFPYILCLCVHVHGVKIFSSLCSTVFHRLRYREFGKFSLSVLHCVHTKVKNNNKGKAKEKSCWFFLHARVPFTAKQQKKRNKLWNEQSSEKQLAKLLINFIARKKVGAEPP